MRPKPLGLVDGRNASTGPGVASSAARRLAMSAWTASRPVYATGPVHTITFIGATAEEYFDM